MMMKIPKDRGRTVAGNGNDLMRMRTTEFINKNGPANAFIAKKRIKTIFGRKMTAAAQTGMVEILNSQVEKPKELIECCGAFCI
jgi:hypothetical protein